MYNIGQKVYCYYDHIFPFIKGTIMNNHHNHSISKEINCDVQLPLKENWYKVAWDDGGVTYFPESRIFLSVQEWIDYNKKIKHMQEKNEYQEYLRLKEKYENK